MSYCQAKARFCSHFSGSYFGACRDGFLNFRQDKCVSLNLSWIYILVVLAIPTYQCHQCLELPDANWRWGALSWANKDYPTMTRGIIALARLQHFWWLWTRTNHDQDMAMLTSTKTWTEIIHIYVWNKRKVFLLGQFQHSWVVQSMELWEFEEKLCDRLNCSQFPVWNILSKKLLENW